MPCPYTPPVSPPCAAGPVTLAFPYLLPFYPYKGLSEGARSRTGGRSIVTSLATVRANPLY